MFVTSIWNFRAITHKPEGYWIDLPVSGSLKLGRAEAADATIRPSREEQTRASRDSGDTHQESEARRAFDRQCRQTIERERPA
jgi:hypothetical protein